MVIHMAWSQDLILFRPKLGHDFQSCHSRPGAWVLGLCKQSVCVCVCVGMHTCLCALPHIVNSFMSIPVNDTPRSMSLCDHVMEC